MTQIEEKSSSGAADSGTVDALQRDLGVSFPADYWAFLVRHDGGHPEPDVWHCGPTQDDPAYGWTETSVTVAMFFPVTDSVSRFTLAAKHTVFRSRVPSGLLAIGDDGAGNLFCLRVDGKDDGSVWFWFHENEVDEGVEPWWDNLQFLAPSFSDFFEGLISFEKDERRTEADLRRVIEEGRTR